MNIKKILFAFICLLSPLFSASCSQSPDNSGIDFTYVEVRHDASGTISVEFSYEGSSLKTYWSDGVEDNLNYHTFTQDCEDKYFIITGDITSISFCDKNGDLLANGNSYVIAVIFSDSITTIHEKAFYGISLNTVVIPTSVKTVEKEAFANFNDSTVFICGVSNGLSGWNDNWDLNVRFLNTHIWNAVLYIENSYLFVLINYGGVKTAIAMLCFSEEENIELNIPNIISNAGNAYIVTNIYSEFCMLVADKVTKVKISDNVEMIGARAFDNCINLESIDINLQNSHLKLIDRFAFSKTKLKEIKIPKTVNMINDSAFEYCYYLEDVYLTEYTNPFEIAYCNDALAYYFNTPITFHYSNGLTKEDFYDKGWPIEIPDYIIWKNESTSLV